MQLFSSVTTDLICRDGCRFCRSPLILVFVPVLIFILVAPMPIAVVVVVVVVVGEFVVFSTSASSMIDKSAVILRFSYLVCPPMDPPKPVGALR